MFFSQILYLHDTVNQRLTQVEKEQKKLQKDINLMAKKNSLTLIRLKLKNDPIKTALPLTLNMNEKPPSQQLILQ
jgi:sensor histidine kinase YesM